MKKYGLVFLIFLFVSILYYYDTFYIIENNLTDRLHDDGREVEQNQIKILAIDEESLENIGKWPWPRDIMAKVVQELADHGAKAIWVDALYTESSQDPKEDKAWEKIIKEHKNVYLSSSFTFKARQDSSQQLEYDRFNRPIFPTPEEQLGHINVMEDRDRIVRKVLLGARDEHNDMIPAISVRLANLLLPQDSQVTWNEQQEWQIGNQKLPSNPRGEIYFTYASSPQEKTEEGLPKFELFSFQKVFKGEIDPSYFQDSIVLIGPYAVGLQDMYYTPMSKTIRMYGVEIHANVIQSLLDRAIYSKASSFYGFAILLILTLISYYLMDRIRAKWAILIYIAFMMAYTIMVYLLLDVQQQLLPFFYPLLALSLVYIYTVVSHYIQERRERNRVTGIFGRYVSKSVVDEILSTQEEIKVGGIRKDVTLLFVDIRGFTPLSEKMQPEEVIQILNEYLDLCTRAVFAQEGTLDKFIGDGVMSIFGAPMAQVDHPERAIRAALLMKEQSADLAKRLEEKYGRSVHFGIGINSGPAVIGNIGSNERLEYTAIGDTVNLAARLESNAKPGQILISDPTYQRVKEHFRVKVLDPIKVKGKEEPVQIYEVEGEAAHV